MPGEDRRAPFRVRPATVADIGILADQRASMFQDMGVLPPHLVERLKASTRAFLERAIPQGEYVGWLASPEADPGPIVAGAGVQRRRAQPFPTNHAGRGPAIADGNQAIVVNVYTVPDWRRRGAARALLLEALAWARAAGIESLVLHATPLGRPLYESLGFVATNEMRFDGDLAVWEP